MHPLQVSPGTSLTSRHPAVAAGAHRAALRILGIVVALGYACDQLSKAGATAGLTEGEPVRVLGPVLSLHLTHNPGAAFSIATSATWVLTVIAIVVIAATLFVARRLASKLWALALGLLIAGACGNLTDRFVRAPGGGKGHVVDFLELPHWPIFNVADICVVSAACLIALLALRGIGVDGRVIEQGGRSGKGDEQESDGDQPADTTHEPVASDHNAADSDHKPADEESAQRRADTTERVSGDG